MNAPRPGARRRRTLLLLGLLCACSGPAEQRRRPEPPRRCERVECLLESIAVEGGGQVRWAVAVTASFRVLFLEDEALVAELARAAEGSWRRQARLWYGPSGRPPWSPRCDLYLYPSRRALIQMTGGDPKAGSAAAQPSKLMRGRMIQRRINLSADDPGLLRATVPHEISHIILAELLGDRPVPLWANEGLAMSVESRRSQAVYDAILAENLSGERLFSMQALMTMSRYPDEEYRGLFYAQSLSLVRFLLGQGGRGRLLELLREPAQPAALESALRAHYAIEGFVELGERWLEFARR